MGATFELCKLTVLFTLLFITQVCRLSQAMSSIKAMGKDQIACTTCSSCENPCQPIFSPPPPVPSPPPPSDSNCPPPPPVPSPPPPSDSNCPPPPAPDGETPSYCPPSSGSGIYPFPQPCGSGIYPFPPPSGSGVHPFPSPPNSMVPYFPIYSNNPPLPSKAPNSIQPKAHHFVSFLALCLSLLLYV